MIWQIKSDTIDTIEINVNHYTAIYNEYETKEEEILEIINNYFQKRNSNKNEVTIFDTVNEEVVSNHLYQSFMLSHETIEKEHSLASSTIMAKKLNRLLIENVEVDSYLNSINELLSDLLAMVHCDLPIVTKMFDHKSFIKQLEFKYHTLEDYSRLIVRLEQLLPLLVEELNRQTQNKTLLIYSYPEANLSPKEQIRFRNILKDLSADIIVLTNSAHFMSEDTKAMNYIRNGKQMLNYSFLKDLEWEAPLDYKSVDIKKSLEQFIKHYQDKVEINPTISNYKIADIMLFEPIDIYVAIKYLKYINQRFELDLCFSNLPTAVSQYIKILCNIEG